MRFSFLDRQQEIQEASKLVFDMVVVGGGINGAGIARDAAHRGLKVLLLEARDLAWGTSSRSSRLIHGGLRYLEHYEFGLVHESVVERWKLLGLAPHLVRPLPFLFPVYKGHKPGLLLMQMGTLAYSALAAFRTPGPRSTWSAARLKSEEPSLRQQDLDGAAGYYDCSTDDARLTLESALDAFEMGTKVFTRCAVTGLTPGKEGWTVRCTDTVSGKDVEFSGLVVVAAAGPWTDGVLNLTAHTSGRWIRPTKGVHLVVRHHRLPVKNAVVMKSLAGDKRISFVIRWGEYPYVGTTDTDFPDPDAPMRVDENDIKYLLDMLAFYFPEGKIVPDDIISGWAGLRPLIAPERDDVDPSSVSREERITEATEGLIAVAGGKLTTYRVICAKVVDKALETMSRRFGRPAQSSDIWDRPLPGAVGIETIPAFKRRLQLDYPNLPPDWLDTLVDRYGSRARQVAELGANESRLLEPLARGHQVRLAEIHHCVLNELAANPEDFLVRRTSLAYHMPRFASELFDKVASEMAGLGVAPLDTLLAEKESFVKEADLFEEALAASRRLQA